MAASEPSAAASGGWTDERSAAGDRNPWILTGVISIATFMVVLDSSIANVALPHIAGSMGTTITESTWVLTAFLIANAIVIPISGWLSEVIGRKRYYMISVVMFTAASCLCALAPNMPILILARIIQGVGGGGLAPNEQSMLADTFPPEKRGMAFAAYAVVVIVGPILGPTVGGYLTDAISWHWIFLINLPFGVLSLVLVNHFVVEPDILIQERRERLRKGVRVDLVGFLLVASGLGSLTYMLAEGQQKDWFASSAIVAATISAVVSLIALVSWERRHPDPIVRLELLANRNFATVIGIIFLIGVILFGSTQVIPQMFQEIYGYDAFTAGLALTLGGFGIMMMMPLAGRLAGRVDARLLIVPAMAALAIGLWHFTTLTIEATFTDLALARFFQTMALPFVFVTINTIAYAGLKPDQTNDASALLNVFRNVGGSVGISISQTILATSSQTYQANLVAGINDLNPTVTNALAAAQLAGKGRLEALGSIYASAVQQARFLAYLDVYRDVAIIMVIVIPFCFFLRGGQGSNAKVMVE